MKCPVCGHKNKQNAVAYLFSGKAKVCRKCQAELIETEKSRTANIMISGLPVAVIAGFGPDNLIAKMLLVSAGLLTFQLAYKPFMKYEIKTDQPKAPISKLLIFTWGALLLFVVILIMYREMNRYSNY